MPNSSKEKRPIMRANIPKKQLAVALGHLERVIPSKASNNVELNLLNINFSENNLVLMGSNLDIDIQASIVADVGSSGNVALPAQVFGQVVRALPGELVELSAETNELEVRSGNYSTNLQLSNNENNIEINFPNNYSGSIEGNIFMKALSSVRYAAAIADYQAIFRGVKLELSDTRVRAIATDGFRLAYYNIEKTTGLQGDIVIPARSVEELIKVLGEEEVKLELTSNQLSVQTGYYKLNIKLMEGQFPDYEKVIPSQFVVSVTLDSKTLLETVTRVAVMADKTTNNRVDILVKDGSIQVNAEGSYGRAQEIIEVSQEGSEPQIALAYNSKYLEDALKGIEGEVRLSFSGTTSPSLLSNNNDPNYLAMIVPLRTG